MLCKAYSQPFKESEALQGNHKILQYEKIKYLGYSNCPYISGALVTWRLTDNRRWEDISNRWTFSFVRKL